MQPEVTQAGKQPDKMDRIYLDYNATTPLDPRVFDVMKPYFLEHFGNPASGQHAWGWTAEAAVTKARDQVAALLGAQVHEVYFTSGATEGNNWALFGLFHQIRAENPGAPIHVLTSAVEHSSVMNAARALRELGAEVDFLPVNSLGQVEPDTVARALKPHTRLLSFIWVNNEIGSVNPIHEIGRLAKNNQIYFHTDATQAVGKVAVDVDAAGVDMLTLSGHKIYGPKGVGAFYLRERRPHVTIKPLFFGGGHEKGLRSGTVNVPGVAGLGAACEILRHEMREENERVTGLRERLWSRLQAALPALRLNGPEHERSPINLSLTLPGRPVDRALPKLQKLGFSTGSACSAGRVSVSHVLSGLGLSEADAACTLRLSLGRWTTAEEVDRAAEILISAFGSDRI
ncbi:MAG: cysteine desulfurase [Bdellovibrionaceae bacterium]|nr:cysteine desulfurase [Pseudobdellovibrionaceae bacterium]